MNIRANVDSSGKTEIPNLAMFHSISLNFVQLAEIDFAGPLKLKLIFNTAKTAKMACIHLTYYNILFISLKIFFIYLFHS